MYVFVRSFEAYFLFNALLVNRKSSANGFGRAEGIDLG